MKYVKSTHETIQMMQAVTHQKESILDALFHYKHPHHKPHYKVNARKEKEDIPLSFIQRLVLRSFIKSLIKKLVNMKGSYKTTLYALMAALGILGAQIMALIDTDPATVFNIEVFISTLVGAFGIFKAGQSARDKDVSTEEERAASK